MALPKLQQDVSQFVKDVQHAVAKARSGDDHSKLNKQWMGIKLELFKFQSDSANHAEFAKIARDATGHACFLSILQEDKDGFERHVKQRRSWSEPEGERTETHSVIQSLYLFHLLSGERTGEFHTELELVPEADKATDFVQVPLEVARALEEGNYTKYYDTLDSMKKNAAIGKHWTLFELFTKELTENTRQRLADILPAAYSEISVADAKKFLHLDTNDEFWTFVQRTNERLMQREADDMSMAQTPSMSMSRRNQRGTQTWVNQNNEGKVICFAKAGVKPLKPWDVIGNVIGYATDLERIV